MIFNGLTKLMLYTIYNLSILYLTLHTCFVPYGFMSFDLESLIAVLGDGVCVSVSVCLPVCLPACLSVCLSACLPACLRACVRACVMHTFLHEKSLLYNACFCIALI